MSSWLNNTAWRELLMAGLTKFSVQQWQKPLFALLIVWILSMLANVFWLLMPEPDTSVASTLMQIPNTQNSQQGQKAETAQVDVPAMQSWHLFGQQAKETVAEEVKPVSNEKALEAEKTRLNLTLLGVMQSSVEGNGYAILSSQGVVGLLKEGQAIPIGQNVKLSKVLSDRVIIDNRGRLESLLLYKETDKPIATVSQASSPDVIDKRADKHLTQIANRYREQLMKNPMSLASVINLAPAQDSQGKMIGYRISPGSDRQLFSDFGLQSGDVVTAVNGMSVADPAEAMELYGQLQNVQQAALSIQRGGENLQILVDLSP